MRRAAAALAFVCASQLCARADEVEQNFAYVPLLGAESLTIDQPLGKLTVRGWDQPEVRIHSTKRANDPATLDRLRVSVELRDGSIRVQTGVRVAGKFVSMPVQSARIDLEIDAPRSALVRAQTWSGDVDASGFRKGAELASKTGEVRARDIDGSVRTSTLRARQWLEAIHGDVSADVEAAGDVELVSIDGDELDAHVDDGTITAKNVTTPVMRLFAAQGAVIFVGTLRAGGRYDFRVLAGDVRLQIPRAPFSIHARASAPITSAFALKGRVTPTDVDADFQSGGPRLELTAVHGHITLDEKR